MLSISNATIEMASDAEKYIYNPNSSSRKGSNAIEGEKQSNGIVQKLFRKHTSKPAKSSSGKTSPETLPSNEFDEAAFEASIKNGPLAGLVAPCPFIRPLQHRLQPRDERVNLTSRDAISITSDQPTSPITIARNRGEASKLLTANAVNEDLTAAKEECIPPDPQIVSDASVSMYLDQKTSLQIDAVATVFGEDEAGVLNWKAWLMCYSQGNFNINIPPSNPTQPDNFVYLPAIYPSREASRISQWAQLELLWPQWAQSTACELVESAMRKFKVPHASVSFFNDKHELFSVENGYHQKMIDRASSIAAHVLYSHDALVILDTKQDWRFRDNPLVTGRPDIRFFAGAPMLSSNGAVMGVFSIFDEVPHAEFPPLERLDLIEMSAIAMKDLNTQADWLSNPELRTTPLMERDSVVTDVLHRQSTRTSITEEDEGLINLDLCPPALRFHKPYQPKDTARSLTPLRIIDHAELSANGVENTPPSSGEYGGRDEFLFGDPLHFGQIQQPPSDTQLDPLSRYYHSPTLHSHPIRLATPRPFFSTDASSINVTPLGSPVRSHDEPRGQPLPDWSIGDFMSLTDADCVERGQESLVGTETSNRDASSLESPSRRQTREKALAELCSSFPVPPTPELEDSRRSSPNRVMPGTPPQTLPPMSAQALHRAMFTETMPSTSPARPPPSPPSPTSPKDDDKPPVTTCNPSLRLSEQSTRSTIKSLESREPRNAKEEAAYEIRKIALTLGYDLVYASELKTKKFKMTEKEMMAPDAVYSKTLTAYGLEYGIEKAIEPNPRAHLAALRRRGPEAYENSNATQSQFYWGIMVPLCMDGPARTRHDGIVIAAYRRPPPQGFEKFPDTAVETTKLAKASLKLKEILERTRTNPDPPKRAKTDPTTHKYNQSGNFAKPKATKSSLDCGDGRKVRAVAQVDDTVRRIRKYKYDSAARYQANQSSEREPLTPTGRDNPESLGPKSTISGLPRTDAPFLQFGDGDSKSSSPDGTDASYDQDSVASSRNTVFNRSEQSGPAMTHSHAKKMYKHLVPPDRYPIADSQIQKHIALSRSIATDSLHRQYASSGGQKKHERSDKPQKPLSRQPTTESLAQQYEVSSRYLEYYDSQQRDTSPSNRYPANAAVKRSSTIIPSRYPANEASELRLPDSPVNDRRAN